MGGDSINQDNLPFLFAPALKQDLQQDGISVNPELENKSRDRVEKARKRHGLLTYERLSEYLLTFTFFGLESYYDISKVPENYT